MPEKPVPRSPIPRQCRTSQRTQPANSLLHLVLAEIQAVEAVRTMQRCFEEDVQQCLLSEVQAVEAVQAVQRCFEEAVQQCLDACPRSLRGNVRCLYEPKWPRTLA